MPIQKFNNVKIKCLKCNSIAMSEYGGHFVACKCGACYMDRMRWKPEIYRMGGNSQDMEVIIDDEKEKT